MAMVFCRGCGTEIHESAVSCPKCGAVQQVQSSVAAGKNRMVALLLCFFLGFFGIHRFYVGRNGSGIIQLLTGGGFIIWAFIDFIRIAMGTFTDSNDAKLV